MSPVSENNPLSLTKQSDNPRIIRRLKREWTFPIGNVVGFLWLFYWFSYSRHQKNRNATSVRKVQPAFTFCVSDCPCVSSKGRGVPFIFGERVKTTCVLCVSLARILSLSPPCSVVFLCTVFVAILPPTKTIFAGRVFGQITLFFFDVFLFLINRLWIWPAKALARTQRCKQFAFRRCAVHSRRGT